MVFWGKWSSLLSVSDVIRAAVVGIIVRLRNARFDWFRLIPGMSSPMMSPPSIIVVMLKAPSSSR